MKPINKKYNNIGIIVSIILNGGCFMLIPHLHSCDYEADPPFPHETIVMEMDFTSSGGGASGGATEINKEVSKTPKESTSDSKSESDETISTIKESSVTQKKPKENKTQDKGNSNTAQNPANDFSNIFGGGGGNSGGGGSGTGTSVGPGTGPTVGSGNADGSGRTVVSKPSLNNPTQEEGRVMVEVTIDQEGNVTRAVAKRSHASTTTSNETLIIEAEKLAKQFKFSKDYTGAPLQTTTFGITFKLE